MLQCWTFLPQICCSTVIPFNKPLYSRFLVIVDGPADTSLARMAFPAPASNATPDSQGAPANLLHPPPGPVHTAVVVAHIGALGDSSFFRALTGCCFFLWIRSLSLLPFDRRLLLSACHFVRSTAVSSYSFPHHSVHLASHFPLHHYHLLLLLRSR